MTPIDPNAVIDAIARHFPDGYEDCDGDDQWPSILCKALGLNDGLDDMRRLLDVRLALSKEGRLRHSSVGYEVITLSHTEQASRIAAALRGRAGFAGDESDIECIANVLAGKTEKKT